MKTNNVASVALADPTYSRVREHLRQDILSGYFSSGSRLKIAELVSRYGVSQMPIREALQQLQGEGLIIIEPNKGAHVRQVDEHLIENMYDIRRLIEVYLTLRSVERMSKKDLKLLHQIQDSYEKAAAKQDYSACLQLNKRFHGVIYELSDNPEGVQILERHWELINGLRLNYGFGSHRTEQVIKEHRALLKALSGGDLAEIEKAASDHCVSAKADLISQMSKE